MKAPTAVCVDCIDVHIVAMHIGLYRHSHQNVTFLCAEIGTHLTPCGSVEYRLLAKPIATASSSLYYCQITVLQPGKGFFYVVFFFRPLKNVVLQPLHNLTVT